MPLTPEQLARMPYQETPATGWDVTEEIVRLSSLIAAIVVGNPMSAGALISDGKKEPGTSVVIQQTRLALALESLVGGEIDAFATSLIDTIKAAS